MVLEVVLVVLEVVLVLYFIFITTFVLPKIDVLRQVLRPTRKTTNC